MLSGVGAFSKEPGEKVPRGDGKLEVEKQSYWSGPEEESPCVPIFSDYADLIKILPLPITLAEAN